MVPDIFANYFLASAGAGAALIGLLFVAVSVRPDRIFGDAAHPVRRGVASATFTALTNAFFVSMGALIPLANVGGVALAVGAVDIAATIALGRGLLRDAWRALGIRSTKARWAARARVTIMLSLSLILYGYEGAIGAGMLLHPRDVGFALALAEVLFGVYAVGLVRAWELLGGPGGIAPWLNPLQDLADTASPAVTPAPGADTPAVM
jgi:hypothetical protein